MNATESALLDRICDMPILDTHEHLPLRPALRETPCDVLTEYLSHYFDKDLISAGMPRPLLDQALDPSLDIEERFARIEPWWDLCRLTGYGRALDEAARGLYGEARVDRASIGRMNEAFQRGVQDGGHFRKVLKDKCRISRSVNDGFAHMKGSGWSDDELFAQVLRLDGYLEGWNFLWNLLGEYGTDMRTFEGFLAAVRADLLASPGYGYAGYKLGVAYSRPLYFARVEERDARAAFDAFLPVFLQDRLAPVPRALQDYILRFCLGILQEMGAFVQIHTGFQEGNGNIVANSDPLLLTELLQDFPGVRFDLFHIGYPYVRQTGVLAKLFPNATVDFAWVNIISPLAAENALCEYLDLVPQNKIFAFGGDYLFVDGVYGHQVQARRTVARALARKVEDGALDLEAAERTAHRLLHDNAIDKLGIRL